MFGFSAILALAGRAAHLEAVRRRVQRPLCDVIPNVDTGPLVGIQSLRGLSATPRLASRQPPVVHSPIPNRVCAGVSVTLGKRLTNTLRAALVIVTLSGCQTSTPTTELEVVGTESATTVPPTTSPSPPPPTSTTLPPSPTPPFATGSIVNGDFETGDIAGWLTEEGPRGELAQPPWGSGWWLVYDSASTPPDPSFENAYHPWEFREPPQGLFAAVSSGASPGRRVLFQDVMLDAPYLLRFTVLYFNLAHVFNTPRHFRWDGQYNTQFRVDLMDPGAPLLSLESADVLANLFQTRDGDPPVLEPTTIAFDLSQWVGKVVRIRFVAVQNRDPFRVGLDDVRLQPIDG